MNITRILVALLIATLMAMLVYLLTQGTKKSGVDSSDEALYRAFMEILPDDLSEPQVEEIEGLLTRFRRLAYRHEIPVEDEVEVKRLLSRYVSAGSISRGDLNQVMARVGYYSVRGSTPDSLGIHPLLEDSL